MHFHALQLQAVTLAVLLGTSWTGAACTTNADCIDGNVCNGSEICQAGVCIAGTPLTCHDNDPCTLDGCDPVAGCTYTPANGCLLDGKKLRLGIGTDARFGLQTGPELAGDAFPENFSNDDPVIHGASLRLLTARGDHFDNIYPLPSASWEYIKGAGNNVGYQYKDFHGVWGPITLIVIRNGKPAKVKGRGPGLNFSLVADPAPVQIDLRFGDQGRHYCLAFGGRVKFFTGVRFTALASRAPDACPMCVTGVDCDDLDPCTVDVCVAGVCHNVPIVCAAPAVCVAGVCQ
jgi:hypothetical protein